MKGIAKIFVLGFMGLICQCRGGASSQKSREQELRKLSIELSREFEEYLSSSVSRSTSSILRSYFQMDKDAQPALSGPEKLLCVDFGGTNLKICVAEAKMNEEHRVSISLTPYAASYRIPHSQPEITQQKTIYQWITEQIVAFSKGIAQQGEVLPTRGALTFSFPLENRGPKVIVTRYTKNVSWTKQGLVNPEIEAPLDELNAALARVLGSTLRFEVVINDAMATLLTGMHASPQAVLGVVLGTGCNSSYYEYARSLAYVGGVKQTCPLASDSPGRVFLLNTECGGFSQRSVRAFQDTISEELDRERHDPLEYLAEKLVGGLYFQEWTNAAFKDLMHRRYGRSPGRQKFLQAIDNLTVLNKDMSTREKLAAVFAGVNISEAQRKECVAFFSAIYAINQEKREYVISGLISAGVSKSQRNNPAQQEFYVCLNGSGWEDQERIDRVKHKVVQILSSRGDTWASRPDAIKMVLDNDASLIGAAYALLSYTAQ